MTPEQMSELVKLIQKSGKVDVLKCLVKAFREAGVNDVADELEEVVFTFQLEAIKFPLVRRSEVKSNA